MSPAPPLTRLQAHLEQLRAAARRAHESALAGELEGAYLALRAVSVHTGAAAELLDQLERVSGGCPGGS